MIKKHVEKNKVLIQNGQKVIGPTNVIFMSLDSHLKQIWATYLSKIERITYIRPRSFLNFFCKNFFQTYFTPPYWA